MLRPYVRPFPRYPTLTYVRLQKDRSVQCLLTYLLDRLPKTSPLRDLLASVSLPTSPNRIALVVSERLINLPVQLMPPMWKFLLEELENARKEVSRRVRRNG